MKCMTSLGHCLWTFLIPATYTGKAYKFFVNNTNFTNLAYNTEMLKIAQLFNVAC